MTDKRVQDLIEKALHEYAKRGGWELPPAFAYDLQISRDPAHGDYFTNLAFKLAKHLHERPNVIADQIVLMIEDEISKGNIAGILERMEVAGAGFINLYLSKGSLGQTLLDVLEKGVKYGVSDFGRSKKILLEFVSANPTGPLTIAHGRQAAVGDALARILRMAGFEVHTEYYLNDAGRQMDLLGQSLWARCLNEAGEPEELPEGGYKGAYLIPIAKKLVQMKGDALRQEDKSQAVSLCRDFAMQEILGIIKEDLKDLRVHFDQYFHESALYQKKAVDEALNELTDRGYLFEQEGALWFRSTAFGDDKDRVVKKSSGEYTYLAPDIAYHRNKFQRGYKHLINLWGPDHHGYIPRLKAACGALGHSEGDVDIRIVQLTTLFRGGVPVRMSTRAGEFVTLRELFEEVGVDATRFFFVMRKIESPLDFDLELAKEKSQDNPVYYLQYAYARIASLLKFAGRDVPSKASLELLSAAEETELIKVISEFPKVIVQAAQILEPYRLSDYLRELATRFHKFYTFHRVVTDDQALTEARLVLVEAARVTLKNGLELLGISQPESM